MSLLNTFYAVRNDEFRYRIMAAMALQAQVILADNSISNVEMRKITADAVIRDPENEGYARPFVWYVITDPSINKSVTADAKVTASDDDIQWVVNEAWKDLYPITQSDPA